MVIDRKLVAADWYERCVALAYEHPADDPRNVFWWSLCLVVDDLVERPGEARAVFDEWLRGLSWRLGLDPLEVWVERV